MKCDVCKQDKDITEFDENKTTCKECVEKLKNKKRDRMIQQILGKAAEIDENDRNKKKDDGYGIV